MNGSKNCVCFRGRFGSAILATVVNATDANSIYLARGSIRNCEA